MSVPHPRSTVGDGTALPPPGPRADMGPARWLPARLFRPHGDDGNALVEFTGLAVLLMVPLVFLPAGPLRLTVRGHALEEG